MLFTFFGFLVNSKSIPASYNMRTVEVSMDYAKPLSGLIDLGQAAVTCPDQRCLLTVMERHGPGLVQMLWRVLGHQADVADAYQETFCRLAVLLHDGKSWNKKGFVYRMAANIAIDMIRKRKRCFNAEEPLDLAAGRETDPAAAAVQQDERQRLQEAIGDLPDHLRHVLVMREFGELEYEAIASAMRISAGTARQYRHRAVMMLAEKLKSSAQGMDKGR
jgi:RNA polymerase sigma-70 factor (ECF subfamily)